MDCPPKSNERELPFFVYGTLRQGEYNAARLHKAGVRARPARLEGVVMFDLGPYPMIVDGAAPNPSASCVVGEVVEVEPSRYEATLRALDRLEGVDPRQPDSLKSLYRRVARNVDLENGDILTAWVYLGREDLARRGRLVTSGDWKRRFANHNDRELGGTS